MLIDMADLALYGMKGYNNWLSLMLMSESVPWGFLQASQQYLNSQKVQEGS
jgi:hypothetical protein